MPTLIGNENIGFELKLTELREEAGQSLQDYELIFHVNGKTRVFSNQPVITRPTPHLVELNNQTVGRFSFNIQPHNEIEKLSKHINDFINNPKRSEMFFEPADPSFELRIERTRHSDGANELLDLSEEEYKVYLWIDGGNSTKLEYTWDAEGIRFLINKTALNHFATALYRVQQ